MAGECDWRVGSESAKTILKGGGDGFVVVHVNVVSQFAGDLRRWNRLAAQVHSELVVW